MTYILKSSQLQFVLNPEKGSWSLYSTQKEGPSLDGVWMRVNYSMGLSSLLRTRRWKFEFIERWFNPRITTEQDQSLIHGDLQKLIVEMGPDVNGINCHIEFGILDQLPLFIWRLSLENTGSRPIRVNRLEMLRAGFFPKKNILPNPGPLSLIIRTKPVGYGAVRPSPEPGDLGFYSNGWQTWSYSGAYSSKDTYRASQLGPFVSPVYYSQGKPPKQKPGLFTSDMFGILGDKTHRTGILAGFLSQKQHFGSLDAYIADPLYPALSLWADGDSTFLNPGSLMTTDWAMIQFVDLDHPNPIAPYLEAVAREHQFKSSHQWSPPTLGWCSWYQYEEDIDEECMQLNLHAAKKMQSTIPIDLFQIDSGFQAAVGDWFNFSPGFPAGVASQAREIKSYGMRPGLWLSPFIVHSRSKLAREHRQWLLRSRLGLFANAGIFWKNINKALDLTHPDALEYVYSVIRTAVEQWGFDYLKLDFLYAAAVKGRYKDRTKTRAQVLRSGLEAIREAAGPEITLLGCGVPFGSAIGVFDSVRIGPDVNSNWKPNFLANFSLIRQEPNLPSVRNALQNIFSRAFFHHKWWNNDPDCLLVRPDTNLTLAEVRSLATAIFFSGGSLILSDDLTGLPDDRLQIVNQLLPLVGEPPRVIDWFDSPRPHLLRLDLKNTTGVWHLLAVLNWSDNIQDFSFPLQVLDIPAADYYMREFWDGKISQVFDGQITVDSVPPHGVQLISLRPCNWDLPLYVGSSFHVSQGLEVSEWAASPEGGVNFQISRPGKAIGFVDLLIRDPVEKFVCTQKKSTWHRNEEGICRIHLEFEDDVKFQIR